jgi:hypothetical protein
MTAARINTLSVDPIATKESVMSDESALTLFFRDLASS